MFGEYELSIDDRGCILLPPEVRRALDPAEEGFTIVIGVNGKAWLYPERKYESLVSSLQGELSPEDDRLALQQMYFSIATTAKWDKQGRLPISAQTRKSTELGTQIVMVGARDHFELWNPLAWEDRKADIRQRTSSHD